MADIAIDADAGIRQFYLEIRALKGRAANDAAWNALLYAIGSAWARYALTDDDAAALENMLRTLRFSKR